jgi:hypothetical protein
LLAIVSTIALIDEVYGEQLIAPYVRNGNIDRDRAGRAVSPVDQKKYIEGIEMRLWGHAWHLKSRPVHAPGARIALVCLLDLF